MVLNRATLALQGVGGATKIPCTPPSLTLGPQLSGSEGLKQVCAVGSVLMMEDVVGQEQDG